MNAELLKKSILQWAIEGKLVSQIDSDSEVKQVSIVSSEVPFSIPSSWKWTTLESVGKWKAGGTPSRSHREYYDKGTIPWLKTGDLNDGLITEVEESITELGLENSSAHVNPKGSVLIAMYGATIGKVGVLGMDCATNQACCACAVNESIVDNWFLFYYLLSQRQEFIKKSAGGAQSNISRAKIIEHPMPIPPIKEQRRIVEKLNEILPIVANYGEEQEALERLEKALPGKLRASLLQEAIQGKLVPQIDEEPSVEQIGVPPEDVPFAIPEKWKWVQLKNLVDVTKQKIPDKDFLYLDVSGVAPSKKSIQSLSAIKANDAPSRARKIVKEGMVLFSTVRPYFLKTVVAENLDLEKETIASTAFAIFSCKNELLNKFIWLVLQSPYFLEYVTSCQKGSTYPAITDKLFYSAYVPLPPVEEQRRIVQKVIELLGEVEKLS